MVQVIADISTKWIIPLSLLCQWPCNFCGWVSWFIWKMNTAVGSRCWAFVGLHYRWNANCCLNSPIGGKARSHPHTGNITTEDMEKLLHENQVHLICHSTTGHSSRPYCKLNWTELIWTELSVFSRNIDSSNFVELRVCATEEAWRKGAVSREGIFPAWHRNWQMLSCSWRCIVICGSSSKSEIVPWRSLKGHWFGWSSQSL